MTALRSLAVFEVDHPNTLAAKRKALAGALTAITEHVRLVPTDFDRRDLASAMAAAGYRESALTVFVWEGVTNYLTEAGVDATLRWCSRASPGSRLFFTYVHRRVLRDPGAFAGTKKLFASLERFGERWTFGIEPSELPSVLSDRGMSLERDLGASQYRELYFREAARAMRGYEFYRIAVARVGAHVAGRDPARRRAS